MSTASSPWIAPRRPGASPYRAYPHQDDLVAYCPEHAPRSMDWDDPTGPVGPADLAGQRIGTGTRRGDRPLRPDAHARIRVRHRTTERVGVARTPGGTYHVLAHGLTGPGRT